jgi:hypothetical protein
MDQDNSWSANVAGILQRTYQEAARIKFPNRLSSLNALSWAREAAGLTFTGGDPARREPVLRTGVIVPGTRPEEEFARAVPAATGQSKENPRRGREAKRVTVDLVPLAS